MNQLDLTDKLTTAQAADMMGVKPGTMAVWRYTKKHNLPYIKIGRSVFYKKSDIQYFLDNFWIKYTTNTTSENI